MFALSMSFLLSSMAVIGPGIVIVALLYLREDDSIKSPMKGMKTGILILGIASTVVGVVSLLFMQSN